MSRPGSSQKLIDMRYSQIKKRNGTFSKMTILENVLLTSGHTEDIRESRIQHCARLLGESC